MAVHGEDRYPSRKWDVRMLGLARYIARWSKDPSTRVGSVVTDDRYRVVGMGVNGLPYRLLGEDSYLNDRSVKLDTIIHAEENAILQSDGDLRGGYLFCYPLPVCSRCMSRIAQVGISRVVMLDIERYRDSSWYDLGLLGVEIAIECGIEIVQYCESVLDDIGV